MSVNHQFVEYSDTVFKRYVKIPPFMVSGTRLDPKTSERITFLLKTPEKDFDFSEKVVKSFNYFEEVLELYSAEEVKLFLKLNRPALDAGLIKEYSENIPHKESFNLLSDEEIDFIAEIRQLNLFKSKIKNITSKLTLDRIKIAAESRNRPISIIRSIEDRISEL